MEEQNIESGETTNKQPCRKRKKKKSRSSGEAKRKKKNLLFVNCNIHLFPPEIWQEILAYVNDVKDLKNISHVCQMFNGMIKDQLWSAPKFKSCISPEDFISLKHLPIKKLDACFIQNKISLAEGMDECCGDEYTAKWIDVISQFTQLTSLKLGLNTYPDISKLSALTNLKSLAFSDLVTDTIKAMFQIRNLPSEELSIEESILKCNVEQISKSAGKMSMLKKLEIQTNNKGCVCLSELSQLEELILNKSNLTIVGCKALCALKLLKKVKFNECWHSEDEMTSSLNMDRLTLILKEDNPKLHVEEIIVNFGF